jgi:replicative DNA helicase
MLLQRSAQHIFEAIVHFWYATYRFINGVSSVKKNAKLEIAGGDFYLIQSLKKISSYILNFTQE